MAADVGLPEGFVLDQAAPQQSGLPEGFVVDQAPAQQPASPDTIKAQQQEMMDAASDPLGLGGTEDTSAGISLGAAVTSQPYWAGWGRRFVEKARGLMGFVSTQEEQDQLARITAEENASIQKRLQANPDEAAAYNLGRGSATLGETYALGRYIPGPKQVGLAGRGVKQMAGRIGYGGLVGGAIAGSEVTPEGQSKAQQAAAGAAGGMALASVTEALSLTTRALVSRFTNKAQAEQSGGLLTENPAYAPGKKLEASTGVTMSPGQVTGSRALSQMSTPEGVKEAQAKQTVRYFLNLSNKVSSSPKLSPELAQKFSEAHDDILSQLVKTRKMVGDFQYARFRGSVDQIYAGKLFRAMDNIAKDAVPGTDAGQIIALRNKLGAELTATKGYLTPEQTLGWKERIDALLAGKSDIFKNLDKANQKRLGANLSDALFASLEDTADRLQLQGKASPALRLRQAVESYKKYSQPMKDLENSALSTVFRRRGADGKTVKLSPEDVGKRLMAMKPTEVRAVYKILDQYRPDLIQEYQATKLYEAATKSVARTATKAAARTVTETKFDPQEAMSRLGDKNDLRAVFDQNPQLLRRVHNGMALLDRISDRVATGDQALVSKAAEGARNAFSLNKIFLAGFGAKMLGPVGLWHLTSTEKGLAVLRTMATAPLKSPQFTAAAEAFIANLDDVSGDQAVQATLPPGAGQAAPQ